MFSLRAKGFDYYVSFGLTTIHLPRYAALQHAERLEAGWEAADLLARESGAFLNLQAAFVWGLLDPARFTRVRKAWSVSWHTVDAQMRKYQPRAQMSYRYDDVYFSNEDSLILNARAIFIEKLPGTILRAEAVEFMPTPGKLDKYRIIFLR